MKSLFEQLGGTYTRQGDYCLPNVCLLPEEEHPIGVYGQRRRVYLKAHHRVLYYNLLTAGTLDGHLADIEEQAQELFLRLVKQYADTEGVTEEVKANDPQAKLYMGNEQAEVDGLRLFCVQKRTMLF